MIDELKLETFYGRLNATKNGIAEVRRSYDPVIAFGFNSLNFFWLDENKTSEVLAYFLNPNEKHGQGTLFLELFLSSIRRLDIWETIKHLDIKVVREKSTNIQRRLDILLEAGNKDFALAIENKIYRDTKDQRNQLDDYNSQLKGWAQENYLLIYLAPKGKEISEASIEKNKREELIDKGNFKQISYENDIIPLVRTWHIHCQALRVKSFLQDFEQYLKNKYTGEIFMSETETLVKQALRVENMEITLALIENSEMIYNELLAQLSLQIRNYATEKGYDLVWGISRYTTWSAFKISSLQLSSLGLDITFEFASKYNQEFYFGFTLKDTNKPLSEEISERLKKLFNDKFKNEPPTADWPCWAYFEDSYWNHNTFLLIAKGEMGKRIIDKIDKLIAIAGLI